jgi:Fic family protein
MAETLFQAPKLDDVERMVIARIEGIRASLKYMLSTSKRWTGLLARVTLAESIRGSNSIEGYLVSKEDAIAAVEGEQPVTDPNTEAWKAVTNYQRSMTYILQLADDPSWIYEENLIRGLHYGMLAYDLAKNPGRWRPGAIHVRREATGEIVYTAPEAEAVPSLMNALVDSLNAEDGEVPSMVKAAIAHLNLVMIHPFSDGNGRMARALQTLVLVKEERIVDKVFCSIEERLGAIRDPYYSVLAEVGTPTWNPTGDARPFVRFCLASHLHQAEMLLQYSRFIAALWGYVEEEGNRRGFPERLHFAMTEAAMKYRVRNATYRRAAGDINEHLASRDLKLLVDQGLLIAEGERRGRIYRAAQPLLDLGARARDEFPPRVSPDPFAEAK